MFPPPLIFLLYLLPLAASLNQEGLYLLQAKQSLDDPDSALSSWNPRDDSPCHWQGVACSPSPSSSVVSLSLPSANLFGPFPSILCRLPNLSSLSLPNNSISGTLPANISDCSSLSHLDLSENLLTGTLPASLPRLSLLTYLDLSYNNFTGAVPISFASFPSLQVISLISNLLDGPFPNFLTNISSLTQLNLSFNPFLPTQLSPQIANLPHLDKLWLSTCSLFGPIPDSFAPLTKLTLLDLSYNAFSGPIPPSLCSGLTSVVQIEIYNNSLTGPLPEFGWANLTALRNFDASMNRLTGTIPDELTRLPLASLNLYENDLEGGLPESIAASPNLIELKVFENRLSGPLPSNLGQNSPLILIDVSTNNFSGEIPATLCAMGKLEQLLLIYNSFSGAIPAALGQCRSLQRIRMRNNRLSGDVPDGLWGLPHMALLELLQNDLSGNISKSIASATSLSNLVISNNWFSGQIPEEVGFLPKLTRLQGSDNRFSGPLPESFVNLVNLDQLILHNNELSGEIPSEIGSMKKLNELNLANNGLSGMIPNGIGSLAELNYLDLSGNQLTGKVPAGLQNLNLNQLNLSNNRLSGSLPPMFAKETYKSSFLGNPGLCGDIAGLCSNSSPSGMRNKGHLWVLIFVLAALVLIVGVGWFYLKFRSFKQVKKGDDRSKWTLMSFHKLGFSEYEILDCLNEDNVIGTGASGKVYKAVLSSGEVVAVKKLWGNANKAVGESEGDVEKGGLPGQDDGFEAEVGTLGKIRHKNIVRLWCCCTTKDCKLLVYEYMPNGSLGDMLHGSKSGVLDWPTRYRIALDAAEGLSYLHHDCVPPIVHRDVKSNNILLDAEYGARVADFGVAKVVDAIGKGSKSMSVIAGSCGYIAPEYAYTLRVNEKSDIYSFGVVVLELITGKLPVDPEYGEKDLVKWVCTTLDQKGVDQIIDPKLDSCFKEEIYKVLNIGLVCTSPLPINRPSMRRVVKMLQEVSGDIHSKSVNKDGKLTPYYYEDASDHGSVV